VKGSYYRLVTKTSVHTAHICCTVWQFLYLRFNSHFPGEPGLAGV